MSSLRLPKRSLDSADLDEAQSRPSKRNFTFPAVIPTSKHHDRRSSEGFPLASLGELRLYIPPIETLPQELLLQVFEHLVHPSLVTAGFPDKQAIHYSNIDDYLEDGELNRYAHRNGLILPIDRKSLRNVCLVSRKFNMAATTLLYRCAQLATVESPRSLLFTLTANPDLQPLIKNISVPWYVGIITDRYDYAFSHDTTNWKLARELYDPPPKLQEEFFAQCGAYVGGGLLRLMAPLVPNLRTLTIIQTNLLDGPFTQDLVFHNLTVLRITLMTPNEVTFYLYDLSFALRTIEWVDPGYIGDRFPALQRLEICSPNGRWEANLVTEEVDTVGGRKLLKYVESLKTTTTNQFAPADWDLLSLMRPIFDSSKLHTLEFDGPGTRCMMAFTHVADTAKWNFDRFFVEKGGGLRTLSLDWECYGTMEDDNPNGEYAQVVYLGPKARVTTLNKLTNLTHLATSLHPLFGNMDEFAGWVDNMGPSTDAELAELLPPSLRTLRISVYIPGAHDYMWDACVDNEFLEDSIHDQSTPIYRFLQALRVFWLLRDEGRELWFRRCLDLDDMAWEFRIHLEFPTSRLEQLDFCLRARLAGILDDTAERDGEFERVLRPPEDMVWDPQRDDDADSDEEDEETTESEEDSEDGEWDQEGEGYTAAVYQDGELVLV